MGNSLSKKTINGVKWTTVSTIANVLMQIGYTSIMARLLSPGAFGIIALANIILRFAGYFGNMGLGASIVQKEHLSDEDVRAAFTSSVILGAVTTVLLWVLAPFSVYIFDEPQLVPILRVMTLSFIIGSLTSTSISILRRNIKFKEMAVVETISYIIGYLGVGVTLGYFGYGVWALVYASLAQSFAFLVLSYLMVRHSMLFLFGWKYYKSLFSYGSRSSLISFTEFIGGELDTMIIGKMLGTKSLGYYNRGFLLINLPIYHMTTNFSKVLFPSFSRIQTDFEKLRKVYLSSITIVASMLIPVGVGIVIGADEIVSVMLGEKWQPSVPILQILGIGLSVGFVNIFAGIVCDATANLSKKIKLTSSFIVIQLVLFVCFSPMGLTGFALAVAIGHFIKTGMYIFLMSKVLKLEAKEISSRYFPGVLNGLYVGLVLFLSKQFFLTLHLPPLIVLIALAMIGGIVLFSVIFVLPGKTLKDEIQGFIVKLDISPSKQGTYNRTMLSYINYLNRR